MLKFFLIVLVIVFSKFLERLERENSGIFGVLCVLLALTFSLSGEVKFQKNQNSTIFENNVSSVLAINSGGGESKDSGSFIPPPNPPRNDRDTSTNDSPTNDSPKYPWGADPSYRPSLGAGSGGNGGNSKPDNFEEKNKIPNQYEWIVDQSIWNSAEKSDSSISQEESTSTAKLEVEIDFPYEYDSKNNPTLLIPNTGPLKKKRAYTKVDFDQTAAHMHHASDFDIQLPADFDMNKYLGLDRAGKLDYVNQMLPRETVIRYQNAIGKSLCPIYNIAGKNLSVSGFAGKNKIGTELSIQQRPGGLNLLGIIREDGKHISSYSLDGSGLKNLVKNDFWVLRDRNL